MSVRGQGHGRTSLWILSQQGTILFAYSYITQRRKTDGEAEFRKRVSWLEGHSFALVIAYLGKCSVSLPHGNSKCT